MSKFFKNHFFSSGWLNTWRPYFLFFVIVFIVYGQTLFFNLTYLDDNALILDRQETISSFKNISQIFSSDVFFSDHRVYYRPLLNLSFMVDAQFGPLNYAVYHLANLLFHILAGGLLFLILKRLFRRSSLALFLTLLFLVHPVLTQAVAWLPGRNDSLAAIFIFSAFLFFLNFIERHKLSDFLLYLSFFGLALLTKESVAFFPLFLIIYLLTIGKEKRTTLTDQGLIFLGSLVIGFICFLMRVLSLSGNQSNSGLALNNIFNNIPAALAMSAKMILPFNLSVFPVAVDTSFIFALIAWPLIILIFILRRRLNLKYLICGVTWFLIFFLPSFLALGAAPFLLEHRLYLPLVGFLIALFSLNDLRHLDFNKKKVWLSGLIILSLFAFISFWHSRSFKDPLTFWRAAIKTSPHSPMANRNLGAMYYLNNDYVKAERYYRAALALNLNEPMAHNNIGVIYLNQGKFSEAEKEFNYELEINPGYDKALLNLAELKYYREHYPARK